MKCGKIGRIIRNNFGDLLTVHLAPSSGQIFDLSNALVYDQTPAKPVTFPSASAVLCL